MQADHGDSCDLSWARASRQRYGGRQDWPTVVTGRHSPESRGRNSDTKASRNDFYVRRKDTRRSDEPGRVHSAPDGIERRRSSQRTPTHAVEKVGGRATPGWGAGPARHGVGRKDEGSQKRQVDRRKRTQGRDGGPALSSVGRAAASRRVGQ
ncbi:hypothetical protein BC628DRAFT_710158 [Trametes gibbosa]|nr:hypothetical protein BC628DRAFT_710158 [Trametes gibbosa]